MRSKQPYPLMGAWRCSCGSSIYDLPGSTYARWLVLSLITGLVECLRLSATGIWGIEVVAAGVSLGSTFDGWFAFAINVGQGTWFCEVLVYVGYRCAYFGRMIARVEWFRHLSGATWSVRSHISHDLRVHQPMQETEHAYNEGVYFVSDQSAGRP